MHPGSKSTFFPLSCLQFELFTAPQKGQWDRPNRPGQLNLTPPYAFCGKIKWRLAVRRKPQQSCETMCGVNAVTVQSQRCCRIAREKDKLRAHAALGNFCAPHSPPVLPSEGLRSVNSIRLHELKQNSICLQGIIYSLSSRSSLTPDLCWGHMMQLLRCLLSYYQATRG